MGQFHPADHSKGDANTIGGYMAVHSRPAAFEGSDGASYSVDIVTDSTGDGYAAYLLFVRWQTGDPVASGHLETEFLAYAGTELDARNAVGALMLNDVRAHLETLIKTQRSTQRPWWEVMRNEDTA